MEEPRATNYLPGGIPEVLSIDVKNNGSRLIGKVKITRVLSRLDPVDLLKAYIRIFVRLLNTPLHYRYLANYDLSWTHKGATKRLVGKALIDHMVLESDDKHGD